MHGRQCFSYICYYFFVIVGMTSLTTPIDTIRIVISKEDKIEIIKTMLDTKNFLKIQDAS